MSSVWKKRWGTLETLLTALAKQYEKAAQDDPWMENMQSLTECLRLFGSSQFHFFHDGFFERKNLYESQYYPKEHVMHATLDQTVYDMSLMQQAAGQRCKEHLRPTLEKADKLAQLAINLAVENNLLKETGVITYFDKSPRIRVIPYAPMALVAIPYTCIEVAEDLLAIPHEVGHYVYRHSPGLAAELRAHTNFHPLVLNWLEEIFCDVYGTLVAGPVIGLDFEDLMFTDSFAEFVTDNGVHPVPAVRPYTYITTLKKLNFEQATHCLKKEWKERLDQRQNPTTFMSATDADAMPLEVAKDIVKTTAKQILAFLFEEKEIHTTQYWSKDSADLAALYPAFAKWANELPKIDPHILKDEGDEVGLTANGSGQLHNKRRKGTTQTWRDWFKTKVIEKESLLTARAWLPIFTSGGWVTQGPDDDGDDGL